MLAKALLRDPRVNITFTYTLQNKLSDLPDELRFSRFLPLEEAPSERFNCLLLTDPMSWDIDTIDNYIQHIDFLTSIFYDLIPLIYPNKYLHEFKTKISYVRRLESLKIIKMFFCDSMSAHDDLSKYLNISQKRLHCVYAGVANSFYQKRIKDDDKNNDLVMITGDDYRKNIIRACIAFAKAYTEKKIPQNARLVIVACLSAYTKAKIKKTLKEWHEISIGKNLIITGGIKDDALISLLSLAKASIFPSLYEGFGLPIIESYAAGTACISSNTSACRELNIVECQFNPKSIDEIKNKIVDIYTSTGLRQKCLAHAKKILAICSWDNVSRQIIDCLLAHEKKRNRIALFGCTLPDKSGIAHYNYLIAKAGESKIDLFGRDSAVYEFYSDRTNLLKSINIYPICSYTDLCLFNNYDVKIFVLGNSKHNYEALESAIKFGSNSDSWLYIHEAELTGLIEAYCKIHHKKIEEIYYSTYGDLDKHDGLRVIIELTGIHRILVNTHKCKELILNSLGKNSNLEIRVLFLPIKNTTIIKMPSNSLATIRNNNEILVGTFGIPGDSKKTLQIIKCIEEIRKTNPKVKLILAGFSVNEFLRTHAIDISNIGYSFDSPSDEELSYLMKTVCVAVQLREQSRGEASGILAEIVTNPVVTVITKNFTNGYPREWFKEIDEPTNTNELIDTINEAIKLSQNRRNHSPKNIDNYSIERFIELFVHSIEEN